MQVPHRSGPTLFKGHQYLVAPQQPCSSCSAGALQVIHGSLQPLLGVQLAGHAGLQGVVPHGVALHGCHVVRPRVQPLQALVAGVQGVGPQVMAREAGVLQQPLVVLQVAVVPHIALARPPCRGGRAQGLPEQLLQRLLGAGQGGLGVARGVGLLLLLLHQPLLHLLLVVLLLVVLVVHAVLRLHHGLLQHAPWRVVALLLHHAMAVARLAARACQQMPGRPALHQVQQVKDHVPWSSAVSGDGAVGHCSSCLERESVDTISWDHGPKR